MNELKNLQKILKEKNIDAYIIPSSDYHNSEYVSDFFKSKTLLSGFTGSAGTMVVTPEEAFLWTDGRYHIQAQKQLENTSVKLMKQGQPDVPSIKDFLYDELEKNQTLGFDGKVLSASFILDLQNKLPNIKIKADEDLINLIWENRPSLPFSMLYILEQFYSGKSHSDKINEIRQIMSNKNVDIHIISSLEDQAWLYNLRANDVLHTPVFLSFTIITNYQCHLFIDTRKIDKNVEKYLKDNDISIHEYEEFYEYIKNLENEKILMDFNKTNYLIYSYLKDKNTLVNEQDPSLLLKAIKNDTEIKNIKYAHIKDGVAFTKFMYYVKTNIQHDSSMTEISVSDYLEEQRRNQQSFVDLSFNTICAYKEHAAMMHYSANNETNYQLNPSDLLLIDSGGHYLDGSTDITRTIALGPISEQQKIHFTTVLKSVIALSNAVFLKGARGTNLDILARGPIWNLLIDYKCGTGHGIGNLLSVHEAPNGFRWQIVPERNDSAVLLPGMITTNEPGIYLENKYGIRIENELLCIEKGKSEFGEFLGFETITYAPIDLDAIDKTLLNVQEITWINRYHKLVYEKISPYLSPEEIEWLKEYTREI